MKNQLRGIDCPLKVCFILQITKRRKKLVCSRENKRAQINRVSRICKWNGLYASGWRRQIEICILRIGVLKFYKVPNLLKDNFVNNLISERKISSHDAVMSPYFWLRGAIFDNLRSYLPKQQNQLYIFVVTQFSLKSKSKKGFLCGTKNKILVN